MSLAVPSLDILGVPVSRITMDDALATIEGWLQAGESHYVCACDVHSLMRARNDPEHLEALKGAGMITPDGQPVVWTARSRGIPDIERVCGPDLLPLLCHQSVAREWKHYFYGGAEGVALALAGQLQTEHPGLNVAGIESPPYRPLSEAEQDAVLNRIRASGAQVLWVGLGCPKQEKWMWAHRDKLPGVVMLGVGAAFDFHIKRIERAPLWMRRNGLEWLHRLFAEPQRLWRRYLILAPQFVVASLAETARLRLRSAAAPR
jgi:N-acetylglucosaminyldiphosphoundecaprenol N-acetyl-beta-D-mannosaminyltransferase